MLVLRDKRRTAVSSIGKTECGVYMFREVVYVRSRALDDLHSDDISA